MTSFNTIAELRAACLDLPTGDTAAAEEATRRNGMLTKPPGALGRLEDAAIWLARWQGRPVPQLERVEVLVFAGNHGVVAQGVSAYPPGVTAQMVANFAAGGAAINQLAALAGAKLSVVPLALDEPTADFTLAQAMDERQFLDAVAAGHGAVPAEADLLCLGEMGIGNTTAASAVAAALFGGGGARWAGRGTGVDDEGLARKRVAIDKALAQHQPVLDDPLAIAAALGGRELAAILGATLAARQQENPRADRRLRLHRCSRAARQARRGHARPRRRLPCLRGRRPPRAAWGARPSCRFSISACGSAKPPAPPSRC